MKKLKFLSSSLAALMLATSAMMPSVAQAEVGASLAISNFYLWRGFDLSAGSPAVSGDISVSADFGGYAGVWASSGDDALGQEYDAFIGWGGEFGDFSVDISYWSYIYPSSDIDFGDAEDIVVGLGFAGLGLTVYESISEADGAEDYRYITLDYSFGDFNILVGKHDGGTGAEGEHLQLSYAYNDNLSFTVTKASDDGIGLDEDLLFNIGYSFSF